MAIGRCRFCAAELARSFVDLGRSPLANAFLSAENINRAEVTYPLHAYVCESCLLVQLEEYETAEIERSSQIDNGDFRVDTSGFDGWYSDRYEAKGLLTLVGADDHVRLYGWS